MRARLVWYRISWNIREATPFSYTLRFNSGPVMEESQDGGCELKDKDKY